MSSILKILAALLMLCSASLVAQTMPPGVLQLDQAQTLITQDGRSERGLAQLPYHWDRLHGARPGQAEFEMAFELPGEPGEPHAVLLPRVGNRFELWLNGTLISRGGVIDAGDLRTDFGKAPRYFALSPALLQKNNLFRIKIEADGGRRAGLAPILFGPEAAVRAAYERAYVQRVSLSLAVLTLMLVMAVVCAALWFTQSAPTAVQHAHDAASPAASPRDRLYAYAGMGALLWTLRLSDRFIETSWLPWPVWGVLMALALSGAVLCVVAFIVHVARWEQRPWAGQYLRAMPGLWALSGLAAAASFWLHQPLWLTLWYLLLCTGAGLFVLRYSAAAVHHGDLPMRLMAGAALINLTLPAYDWWNYRISHALSDTAWSSLGSALYALVMLYIAVARFRSASAQARELMHTLEARVAQREAQLSESYQQLELLAREQAQTQERTRILRDMHDGVGAHISAAIRQVQSGQAATEQVLATLRDSLDQLKLSIDAMHLESGDVMALLANLRYRLEPRLTSSGMALNWQVDDLPLVPRLDHAALRQLQFMLFEAFSNILQHAQAKLVTVQAQAEAKAGVVKIAVIDDGCGFDVSLPARGLASMRARAQAIGAQLQIQSRAGQTVVEISLVQAYDH
jgi:signal transduction histidine kinase